MKDFYENAVGNEKIVERLQFISRNNPYPKELLSILYLAILHAYCIVPETIQVVCNKDFILWIKGWDGTIARGGIGRSPALQVYPDIIFAARVGVPATILAFSALYWGYGLSKYQE